MQKDMTLWQKNDIGNIFDFIIANNHKK